MPKGKVAAGLVLLLVGAQLMVASFLSPARIVEFSDTVLTDTDLFKIGAFVNVVAFLLLAFGMPRATTLTTHWLNTIGMVSIALGLLGLGLCVIYQSLNPLILALGVTGVSSACVSLHVRDRPRRLPDNRKPTALSENELAKAIERMREKNFSVAF